jgi:membrane fusion protein, multidrug efflux system
MHKVLDRPGEGATQIASARKGSGRGVILALLAAAVVAALGWWLKSGTSPASPQRRSEDQATVVRLGEVTRGDVPVALEALGTVTPLSTVTVKTQISGKLTEVGFTEGQGVKVGDFLAQIDPRPYQAALDQAQGQLARDEAMLAAARIDLARYEKLMSQDSIARQQVDTQRALVTQDEAIVRSDRANVEAAALNLNYCRIVSPSNGRVGLRLVDPGNYVQPSDANGVVVITQMQPMSVVFTLPEDDIPKFLKKLRAGVDLPVLAFDRSSTTQLATGKLETIDNQIDPTTGTVKLRAIFANDDEALFPNQFVNTKLVVDTLRGATIAPAAAVQIGAPGNYVYVANDNATVAVRSVKLGPRDGQNVTVLQGLAPGEKVVVDGVDRLRDGAKIRVPGVGGRAAGAGEGAKSGQNSGQTPAASAPQNPPQNSGQNTPQNSGRDAAKGSAQPRQKTQK